MPNIVFYVGSGLNLCGPGIKVSLKFQYLNGARKELLRLPMQRELAQKGGVFWTEVLHIHDLGLKSAIDTECSQSMKTQLETIENYFIYLSFQDYLSAYRAYGTTIFSFHNSKLDKLRALVGHLK
jgi:hypothetical protein